MTASAPKVLLIVCPLGVPSWQYSQAVIFGHPRPSSYPLDQGETHLPETEQQDEVSKHYLKWLLKSDKNAVNVFVLFFFQVALGTACVCVSSQLTEKSAVNLCHFHPNLVKTIKLKIHFKKSPNFFSTLLLNSALFSNFYNTLHAQQDALISHRVRSSMVWGFFTLV